jgi:hypothetical protein
LRRALSKPDEIKVGLLSRSGPFRSRTEERNSLKLPAIAVLRVPFFPPQPPFPTWGKSGEIWSRGKQSSSWKLNLAELSVQVAMVSRVTASYTQVGFVRASAEVQTDMKVQVQKDREKDREMTETTEKGGKKRKILAVLRVLRVLRALSDLTVLLALLVLSVLLVTGKKKGLLL